MKVLIPAFAETPLQAIEQAQLVPMEAPVPGPGEVVVSVKSASVAWVDLLMTSGNYQHMPKPPYTPGLEYAGVVSAIGPGVTRFAVGDRVLSDGMFTGPRSLGAYQLYGGFAAHALAPENGVIAIPGTLTFDEACNLLGNYETAYHCLVARGRLQANELVLIHGASGAAGLAAVQIAKIIGATVVATGRSEAKLALVKAQGADHVIAGSFREQVKTLGGADVVYDGVGGDVSLESLRCVKFGARFLIVGWASTPFAKSAPNQLPTNLIMMKGLDVLGCPMAISTAQDPSIRQARLSQVLRWAAEGRIRPHVSHRFPLASFKDAMRAKWNGEVVGGCVLQP